MELASPAQAKHSARETNPSRPARRHDGPPRRADPPHGIRLRPAHRPRPADRAAAARAAFAHADPVLLAEHHAERPFHQLAAGSVRQLSGAAGLSREDARVQGDGRSRGGHGDDQSVRFFPRRVCARLPVQLRAGAARRSWRPISRRPSRGRCSGDYLAKLAHRREDHHRFHLGAQPAAPARHQISHPHGARRADAGGDAAQRRPAPAATPAGCWCSSCAISGWRRASSPAT